MPISTSPALTSITAEPSPPKWTTSPIIDYEPSPEPVDRLPAPACATPSAAALHRRSQHSLARAAAHSREPVPPRSAVVFAETALRQVIEVIDRRRPVSQLRPLMTPALVERILARAGVRRQGSATMLRVRVRSVDPGRDEDGKPGEVQAAEVFASFTRSGRVHAVAARINKHRGRWRMVALQIG